MKIKIITAILFSYATIFSSQQSLSISEAFKQLELTLTTFNGNCTILKGYDDQKKKTTQHQQ